VLLMGINVMSQRGFMPSRLQTVRTIILLLFADVFCGLAVQLPGQNTTAGDRTSGNASGDNLEAAGQTQSIEIPAVNYFALGEAKIEFVATDVARGASGQARVKMLKDGGVSVEAKFVGLGSPTKFGNEYLTYMLWATVPKGRTRKVGEVVVDGNGGKVVATTALQNFAMLVTAEPYAAVTQPSSIAILKGSSPGGDRMSAAFAEVELLRGAYAPSAYSYEPLDASSGYAPVIVQAMNARRVAKSMQAEKYAGAQFRNAEGLYQAMINTAIQGKKPSKQVLQMAKVAAETYEDARARASRQLAARQKQ